MAADTEIKPALPTAGPGSPCPSQPTYVSSRRSCLARGRAGLSSEDHPPGDAARDCQRRAQGGQSGARPINHRICLGTSSNCQPIYPKRDKGVPRQPWQGAVPAGVCTSPCNREFALRDARLKAGPAPTAQLFHGKSTPGQGAGGTALWF